MAPSSSSTRQRPAGPSPIPAAWRRSCASCSTTRCVSRRRRARSRSACPHPLQPPRSLCATTGLAWPATTPNASSSASSAAAMPAARPASASDSRSAASSRSAWTPGWTSCARRWAPDSCWRSSPRRQRPWRTHEEGGAGVLDRGRQGHLRHELERRRRPGDALSRYQLLERAWDYDYENRSNVLDIYVRYLRDKIDRPFDVASFETVRGPATACAPRATSRTPIFLPAANEGTIRKV